MYRFTFAVVLCNSGFHTCACVLVGAWVMAENKIGGWSLVSLIRVPLLCCALLSGIKSHGQHTGVSSWTMRPFDVSDEILMGSWVRGMTRIEETRQELAYKYLSMYKSTRDNVSATPRRNRLDVSSAQ